MFICKHDSQFICWGVCIPNLSVPLNICIPYLSVQLCVYSQFICQLCVFPIYLFSCVYSQFKCSTVYIPNLSVWMYAYCICYFWIHLFNCIYSQFICLDECILHMLFLDSPVQLKACEVWKLSSSCRKPVIFSLGKNYVFI